MKYLLILIAIIMVSCNMGSDSSGNIEVPLQDSSEINDSQSSDDDDDRQYWQKPEEVMAMLGNLENKVVADIGAGIGYFTFKLLPNASKVIAIDVDTVKINILNGFKDGLPDNLKGKLDIRRATPDDSKLLTDEADVVLIVNTIAYIDNRVQYFEALKTKLKEEGQIAIVDFKTKIIPEYVNAPPYDEREYLHIIEEELISAGYEIIVTDDTSLEYQYMVFAQAMNE